MAHRPAVIGLVVPASCQLEGALTSRAIQAGLRSVLPDAAFRLFCDDHSGPYDPHAPVERYAAIRHASLDGIWIEGATPDAKLRGTGVVWNRAGNADPGTSVEPTWEVCDSDRLSIDGARSIGVEVTQRRLAFLRLLDWIPPNPYLLVDIEASRVDDAASLADGSSPAVILSERLGAMPPLGTNARVGRMWVPPPVLVIEDVVAVIRGAARVVTDRPVTYGLARSEGVSVSFRGELPVSPSRKPPLDEYAWRRLAEVLTGAAAPGGRDEPCIIGEETVALRRAYDVRGERLVYERMVFTDRLVQLEEENERLRQGLRVAGRDAWP